MTVYQSMPQSKLSAEYERLLAEYREQQEKNLKLDISRGKPGREQLDLVSELLTALKPEDLPRTGADVRNYGSLSGLPEAKRLFAELLGCRPEQCFVGGNASLQLMYSVISNAFCFGLPDSPRPWCREEHVKWLCPVPGYDRHFRITETFGFEMLPVPMLPGGPDMDLIEKLVADPAVKGIWCVPKFSNPDGIVYSDETLRRFASLKPAAPDFTVMWDNAYCVHEFDCDYVPFADILSLAAECGNPDMFYEFASTSKITFPGAGISVLATSERNLAAYEKIAGVQIISYDKVNQLRHVRYLRDKDHTLELMRRHAGVLKPKFDCVLRKLSEKIAPLGLATWQVPEGGYFVSVNTAPGLAKRTLELCKNAGVVMTPAGAAFPLGKDPNDSNIRIAPSLPPVEELSDAMDVFCVCLMLAGAEQALQLRKEQ